MRCRDERGLAQGALAGGEPVGGERGAVESGGPETGDVLFAGGAAVKEAPGEFLQGVTSAQDATDEEHDQQYRGVDWRG